MGRNNEEKKGEEITEPGGPEIPQEPQRQQEKKGLPEEIIDDKDAAKRGTDGKQDAAPPILPPPFIL
jgi:hypothetical protein